MKNQIERAEPHVHECGIEGGPHKSCFCVVCNESYPNKKFVERAEPSRGAPDAHVCKPSCHNPCLLDDSGARLRRQFDQSTRSELLAKNEWFRERDKELQQRLSDEEAEFFQQQKHYEGKIEQLKSGHVVLLEALRRRQKEGHGHGCIFFLMNGNRCDCGFVEAEAAIKQAERT